MFNLLSPFKLYAALGAVLILSVIVGVHLYHDRGVRIERDTAVSDLASYKSQVETETAKRNAENAAAKKMGEQVAITAKTEYAALKQKLSLSETTTEQLRRALSNEKTIINRALVNQLRVKTAGDTASLPEVSSATELPAESGNDSDRTIATLTRACQDTTVAYNSLWSSWENNCKIYGCDGM